SPGESIYAALRDTPNSSALYSLSEFRIQAYDADGKLLQEETRSVENGSEPILTIPETCPEGGYAILPIGQYVAGSIRTEIYYTDSEGNICPLSNTGTWKLNGTPLTSQEVEVSSVSKPALTYTIDSENYFFVS